MDESRLGTQTKHGLGWFKKGSRTRIDTKQGFKSFYIYSATNGKTGDIFSLIMPGVDKLCMQAFLDEFSRSLETRRAVLVMDGAGWHKGLKLPSNIRIMFLPPYSPELNPVERLWQHIKSIVLTNKVYEELKDLERDVIQCLKAITGDIIKSICNCSYVD